MYCCVKIEFCRNLKIIDKKGQEMGSNNTGGIIDETPEIWGDEYTTESSQVEQDYNTFADTGEYDETFSKWGYVAPDAAAKLMKKYLPADDVAILDVACGSGLTGTALKNVGYTNIDGIDIAGELLKIAEETQAYQNLSRVDMQQLPLPFEDNQYDAINFIGALTYFETSDILKDLCRITRNGGYIVFTQRDDIMRKKNYGELLDAMEQEGHWEKAESSEPMPYLPNHPEYGDDIQVQFFVYKVTK